MPLPHLPVLQMANYDFYNKVSGICCDALDSYEFPVFKSSVSDAKAAETKTDQTASPLPVRKDSSKFDVVGVMSSLSLALSLGMYDLSVLYCYADAWFYYRIFPYYSRHPLYCQPSSSNH